MSLQNPNLNYEFYFLFRVKDDPWQEPSFLSHSFIQNDLQSIRVDKDKRLFRYAPPPNQAGELPPLSAWAQYLPPGWEQIRACYQADFNPNALMGVALLILDESISAAHRIQCQTDEGRVIFQPVADKTPSEKILLTVTAPMLQTPVTLEEFEPHYDPPTDWEHWQIELSAAQLNLVPMQPNKNYAEDDPNPIFTVYGLAHGMLPDEVADQLQTFLCSSQVSLMARLLPRLMMQKWQFKRLDIAAYQIRQQLDLQNEHYRKVPDGRLACASNHQLEEDLRFMTQMEAAAKRVLARLDAGAKTLKINRDNLKKHLHRSEQVWQYLEHDAPTDNKCQWTLRWHNDSDTPLLDGFKLDIRKLKNHTTYLQDALAYLEGIRTRWRLYFDGQRSRYEANIQLMLLILTFIASFAGVIALITQYPADVAFLLERFSDHPPQIIQIGRWLLISINSLIFMMILYWSLRWLGKKLRCCFKYGQLD
jgi:hypothetical protein